MKRKIAVTTKIQNCQEMSTISKTSILYSPFIPQFLLGEDFPLIASLDNEDEIEKLKALGWTEMVIFNEGESLPGYSGFPLGVESMFGVSMGMQRSGASVKWGNGVFFEAKRIPLSKDTNGEPCDYIPDIESMVPGNDGAQFYRSPSCTPLPFFVRTTNLQNELALKRAEWIPIVVFEGLDKIPFLTKIDEENPAYKASIIAAAERVATDKAAALQRLTSAFSSFDSSFRTNDGDDDDHDDAPLPSWLPEKYSYLRYDDKETLMEVANGLGGGHYVREGLPMLKAYAKAHEVPYKIFVRLLQEAPGEFSSYWTNCMTKRELQILGLRSEGGDNHDNHDNNDNNDDDDEDDNSDGDDSDDDDDDDDGSDEEDDDDDYDDDDDDGDDDDEDGDEGRDDIEEAGVGTKSPKEMLRHLAALMGIDPDSIPGLDGVTGSDES